ncbi:MAG: Holliday junction branch migration DNA helicase RuvB [Mycoplasmataceae bacterium]|jgi:Holliday junction DNA helicase RuvB|nr:Holliday junction branch migration DNA helicase RuvB [Mycoplasmataceae bacterium]
MQVSLRPTSLSEFKGKTELKENLKIYLQSSLIQNKAMDHCLLYGLPGTGKTSLAHIIANELHRRIRVVQGGNIQKNIDIINLAMTLNEYDILFIDEIHAINPQCIELLYCVMEDFVIDIALGKDFNSRITRIKIPQFTLIGATTLFGKISQPLEERFGIVLNIKSYSLDDIIEIIKSSIKKIELDLKDEEIILLAKNSKGIPRNANRLVRRIKDFRISNKSLSINAILKKLSIIDGGLDQDDLHYLKALKNANRPLGLNTISQIINIDRVTIETKIEPFLIQSQYVNRNLNGRELTNSGNKFIEKYSVLLKH